MSRLHYAGGLRYRSRGQLVRVLAGWAACCTGEAAQRVANLGLHTDDPDEVSCAKCRRLLDRADELAE